jgi:quercetin dioxygenase-like cupin family protein
MATYKYNAMQVFRPSATVERRQAYTDHVMMTIVDFSGGPTPPAPAHKHPHEQITYVAQGPINFIIGEGSKKEVTRLETGDIFIAPGNAPHTVEVLGKTARLIDCFYPIREDFLK